MRRPDPTPLLLSSLLVAVMIAPAPGAEPTLRAGFEIAGHPEATARLNAMFQLHYGPRTDCTLWDPWMPRASLWEAAAPDGNARAMREYYRNVLLSRRIDDEGYVATQQHRGLAHADGWPFPIWQQARGAGWHYSLAHDAYAVGLGTPLTKSLDGWDQTGLRLEKIDPERGAILTITQPDATLTTPPFQVSFLSSPFARLEWAANGFPAGTTASFQWATTEHPDFDDARSLPVPLPSEADGMIYTMIPLYRHANKNETFTRFRITIKSPQGGALTLKSLITAIDTRHPINNAVYVHACADYYDSTTDREFLRAALPRLRTAIQFALDEFQVRENGAVVVPWVGHDGRTGLLRDSNGKKTIRTGVGVGNNYWDLLPFGGHDLQATLYLDHALLRLAALEREAETLQPPLDATNRLNPDDLEALSASIRERSRKMFWNDETGRFAGWIDADGQKHDMGLTTLNTETIAYGFASDDQARSIMDWLEGKRIVNGDTSTGNDIYHWRFAPRATTRRNIDTYAWVWSNPESIPWGDQVQDGGAVLGWSSFDLMARLRVNGSDDAWNRLRAILDWFGEVQSEGGYRAYYAKPGRGHLQGGGTPGGLGLDAEFFESLLVPHFVLEGFLGFKPQPEGARIRPRLPRDVPALSVSGLHIQDIIITLRATPDTLTLLRNGPLTPKAPLRLDLEAGRWEIQPLDADGKPSGNTRTATVTPTQPLVLDLKEHPGARLRHLDSRSSNK